MVLEVTMHHCLDLQSRSWRQCDAPKRLHLRKITIRYHNPYQNMNLLGSEHLRSHKTKTASRSKMKLRDDCTAYPEQVNTREFATTARNYSPQFNNYETTPHSFPSNLYAINVIQITEASGT